MGAIHTTEYEVYEATVISKTAKALYCEIDGTRHWIPFSQILLDSIIDEGSEPGDSGELVIPRWLAERLF